MARVFQRRYRMNQTYRFSNISPLDHRYWIANPELFDRLATYLSEEAAVRSCVRVEVALLREHLFRLLPERRETDDTLTAAEDNVTAALVYEEEQKTRHNIRAVVNVMQRFVPEDIRHLVHLGATSVDILDTAAALRYRDVSSEVLLPLLRDLQEQLITLAENEADTVQIGRTHGQYAVPITVGFALAEYVSRLGSSIIEIERRLTMLRGKLSGAVGSYNATSVLYPDPVEFEAAVLARLNLKAGEHATQIVSPEPLLRLLLEYNTAFGIIANLADDLRHLQRSEIGEFREFFAPGQVGSSTMPHKRNPWNAEHVKSLWKAFAPRAVTWFMDQISEHQRDLSNSASGRFVAEYLGGFAAATARMVSILKKIEVDREGLEKNLSAGARMVLAEPMYVILAATGVADAHERIRSATLLAEAEEISLIEAAQSDVALWDAVRAGCRKLTGIDADEFFSDPRRYTGQAAQRAREVCRHHRELLTDPGTGTGLDG